MISILFNPTAAPEFWRGSVEKDTESKGTVSQPAPQRQILLYCEILHQWCLLGFLWNTVNFMRLSIYDLVQDF